MNALGKVRRRRGTWREIFAPRAVEKFDYVADVRPKGDEGGVACEPLDLVIEVQFLELIFLHKARCRIEHVQFVGQSVTKNDLCSFHIVFAWRETLGHD